MKIGTIGCVQQKKGFQTKLIPEYLFNYRRHTKGVNSDAREHHSLQAEYIRKLHPDLKNRISILKIKFGYKNQVAINPFENMNRSKTFNPSYVKRASIGIIANKVRDIETFLEKADETAKSNKNLFIFYTSDEVKDSLTEHFYGVTPLVYIPTNYLLKENTTEYIKKLIEHYKINELVVTDPNLQEVFSEKGIPLTVL